MQLVPIPTTPAYLTATFDLWSPFLPDIAARSPFSVDELLGKLARHEIQPVLVFNDENKPVVLIGICITDDGGKRVGAIEWMTFKREVGYRDVRARILADLESYLRDHVKCVKCRPVPPPGWRRFLEKHGYTLIGKTEDRHIIMEKVL